jgi:lipopolysaccharide export system permease protein
VSDSAGRREGSAALRRRTNLAPFGWYTWCRLRSYGSHCFVTIAALAAIGISIDLPSHLSQVVANVPSATELQVVGEVAWYVLLRVADIATELLPVATFLGVLWSEAAHTWSRERLTIWNTGRSPLMCMTPALLFGLCLGGLQGGLDIWLRPAAVMAQVSERLGDYGERFDRSGIRPVLVAAGRDVVRARLDYGPPPILLDVKVYYLDGLGHLAGVLFAERATPGSVPGTWIFENGSRWDAAGEVTHGQFSRAEPPTPAGRQFRFDRFETDLQLPPEWLSYRGIQAQYLPQPVLASIAAAKLDAKTLASYRTWLQVRYGRMAITFGMALLAATLGMLALQYAVSIRGLLLAALAGYGAHVLLRLLVMLGEFGQLPPAVAGWGVPALLLIASAGPLVAIERRARTRNGWPHRET